MHAGPSANPLAAAISALESRNSLTADDAAFLLQYMQGTAPARPGKGFSSLGVQVLLFMIVPVSTSMLGASGAFSTRSFSLQLVLVAHYQTAFTRQLEVASAAQELRCAHLGSVASIPELGKTFLLKDRHAACLDLAQAIQAVHKRFEVFRAGGGRQPENIAVAGRFACAGLCFITCGLCCVKLCRCCYCRFHLTSSEQRVAAPLVMMDPL